MFIQYSAAGYERVKSSVFNLRLNTGSGGDDETKGGKLFQTREPRLETHEHQSSSVLITEWQVTTCLMIEVAVENIRRSPCLIYSTSMLLDQLHRYLMQ